MSKKFSKIVKDLQNMFEKDQKMRQESTTNSKTWNTKVDHENTARLKGIIKQIGWPTISKVGKAGANQAWLLAQHADHDTAFQKDCLKLMKKEAETEVDKKDLAYLEDRIAVNEGRSQTYGTQFYKDSKGQMQPRPIFDEKHLEQRRQEVGLVPFEHYRKRMQEKKKF